MAQHNSDLLEHIKLIESAMDLIVFFSQNFLHRNDDDLTVQHLGIRIFNAAGSSLKLTMSGYFQNAAAIQRDILETVFLLSYFASFPEKVKEWREIDPQERDKRFKTVKIREALDKRDGFSMRRREAAYKMFCRAASHPTAEGFAMLRPDGKTAHVGPFLSEYWLKPVIEELAKIMAQAGSVFGKLFPNETPEQMFAKATFLDVSERWFSRFYEKPYDPTPMEEIKEAISELNKSLRR